MFKGMNLKGGVTVGRRLGEPAKKVPGVENDLWCSYSIVRIFYQCPKKAI